MNPRDATLAQQALGACAAMLRSGDERGDGRVGPDALADVRTLTAGWSLDDNLTGNLRASGTAMSRLAIARKYSVLSAATSVAGTIKKLGRHDALGFGLGTTPY